MAAAGGGGCVCWWVTPRSRRVSEGKGEAGGLGAVGEAKACAAPTWRVSERPQESPLGGKDFSMPLEGNDQGGQMASPCSLLLLPCPARQTLEPAVFGGSVVCASRCLCLTD